MATPRGYRPLAGSHRRPMSGARRRGLLDRSTRMQVTVLLRPTQPLPDIAVRMDRRQFAARHGARAQDLAALRLFAAEHDLDVVEEHQPARTVKLAGSVGQMGRAFRVRLDRWEHPGGWYRGRTGPVHIPEELAGVVAVLGLDDRPALRTHHRHRPSPGPDARGADSRFYATALAARDHYPATGGGQTVAILEFGGGYSLPDLATYWSAIGHTPPQVSSISVDGAANSPGSDGGSVETMLDIAILSAVAPQARQAVYVAPNTSAGFVDAYLAAIHDTVTSPCAISLSWGSAEQNWTPAAISALEDVLHTAALFGITCTCSSGDDGSSDGVHDGLAHADYPASSPWMLACGGTTLVRTGQTITDEVVWDWGGADGNSGGGISDLFDLPDYQASTNIPPSINPGSRIGRGGPDVATAAADGTSIVLVGGQWAVIGGTSAVSPMLAGLAAQLTQTLGYRVGHLHPFLYRNPQVCRDIVAGNNRGYSARAGWDACTGLGVPDGAALLSALYPARLTATVSTSGSTVDLSLRWPQFTTATIYRVGPDGVRTPIAGATPATLTGGVWTGSDPAAPTNTPVHYQAVDGELAASSMISNTVTVTALLVSQQFLDALRGPHSMTARIVPYVGSTRVQIPGYPDGLPVVDGQVQVDATQRIRRQLTCTIAAPGLSPWQVTDLLSGVNGVELYVNWGLVYPDGSIEWCPLGLFHLEEADAVVESSSGVSLTQTSDRGGFVTDYRFTATTQSLPGATVASEIARLMGLALPPGAINTSPIIRADAVTVAAQMTWTDADRWAAIGQLEDAIGAEGYFDARGHPVVQPVATLADPPVWTVDAGPAGVMTGATRRVGRTRTFNAVVVRGERLDGETPVQVMLVDSDPSSHTSWQGPFGKKPRFFSSPLISNNAQGAAVAGALLAQVTQWTSVLQVSNIVNAALDGSQVIQAVYPDAHAERQIIDQMTIPLVPGQPMTIQTRAYTAPAES
ncbi:MULTISPECIES: DUF5047 domain-containing protein [Frankia]|nr:MULTISPECIES: DUF5047 domain-containing protein [Frankia]